MSCNKMPPWTLKILIEDHFPGVLTNLTNMKRVIRLMQSKLIEKKQNLFRKSIFEHFTSMKEIEI